MKKNWCVITILLIGSLMFIYFMYNAFVNNRQNIIKATDNWINAVTVKHDPAKIANLFCSDGNLVGTVSKIKRTGKDINLYFEYFANLPGIKVISKEYNISKVTSNVYINTAFITWVWDSLDQPIVARMTFVFRDNCIFQLHSSALPELNKNLLNISGAK